MNDIFSLDFLIRGDPIRNGGVWMSCLLLVGGFVLLAARTVAAHQGFKPIRNVVVFRMLAVLAALGGFMGYLRDMSSPAARQDLIVGGLAAAPWVGVMLLEKVRSWLAHRGTPRPW